MAKRRKKRKIRQCQNPDCRKNLSMYNKGRYCFSCDAASDEDIPSMHSNRK